MLNRRSHTSADVDLRSIAKRAMLDRGFLIQVTDEAQSQLTIEREPAFETLKEAIRPFETGAAKEILRMAGAVV